MRRTATILAACVMLLPLLASGQETTKTTVKVTVDVEFEDIIAMSELPEHVDTAVKSGSDDEEISKAVKALKKKKVKGKAAVAITGKFKKHAEEGKSGKGMSGAVHGCLDSGHKGTDLVACFKDEWDKKPAKEEDEGKHKGREKHEDKGKHKEAKEGKGHGKKPDKEDKGKHKEAKEGKGHGKKPDKEDKGGGKGKGAKKEKKGKGADRDEAKGASKGKKMGKGPK
jgi:hypothetical protein